MATSLFFSFLKLHLDGVWSAPLQIVVVFFFIVFITSDELRRGIYSSVAVCLKAEVSLRTHWSYLDLHLQPQLRKKTHKLPAKECQWNPPEKWHFTPAKQQHEVTTACPGQTVCDVLPRYVETDDSYALCCLFPRRHRTEISSYSFKLRHSICQNQ